MESPGFMIDEDIKEKRMEAFAGLEEALEEIKSGEGLSTFVEGHGMQSRRFRFEWREPSLQISYDLPTGRVLSPEEDQKADDEEVGAAIRLALVLFHAVQDGKTAVQDGKTEVFEDGMLSVSCDDNGTHYALYAPDGSVKDEGDGWGGLVSRLEAIYRDSAEELIIFMP